MIRYTIKILLALGLALLVYSIGMPGCSPTQFATVVPCSDFAPEFNCQSETVDGRLIDIDLPHFGSEPTPPEKGPGPGPTSDQGQRGNKIPPRAPSPQYTVFNYDVSLGQVSIIFVDDNSSSMAVEQRSIADQLRSFLQRIRDVDYHVAVITTDISSSPGNPVRGAYYQDGKFIPIGRRIFLRNENIGKNPARQVIDDFKRAITREETTRCDQRNQPRSSGSRFDRFYQNQDPPVQCPGHDERAIYALNMAIQNPRHQAFFRPQARLIIVILSDEDERSGKEFYTQRRFEQYALEPNDYPEVLVEKIFYRFGALKRFSVHSIIIPPGDTGCLSEQNRARSGGEGTGRGYYGVQYARLSNAEESVLTQYGNLIRGNVISICDRRYGAQLQRIAVAANTIRSPLPCDRPVKVELYVSGRKTRASYKIEGRTLIMEPGEVPLNSQLKLRVVCRK